MDHCADCAWPYLYPSGTGGFEKQFVSGHDQKVCGRVSKGTGSRGIDKYGRNQRAGNSMPADSGCSVGGVRIPLHSQQQTGGLLPQHSSKAASIIFSFLF